MDPCDTLDRVNRSRSPAAAAPPARSSPNAVPLARLLLATADAVAAVRAGRSLTDVLGAVPADLRAGTQALAFHVMRWMGSAQAARAVLAPRPPPAPVDALLVSALALLWPTGEPPPYADHTLVDQAVSAARQRVPAAAGFVNAVLRRFVRERDPVAEAVRRDPVGRWNHPAWWVDRLRADWLRQWQAVLDTDQRHPPMTLRANARRVDAAAYVERLAAAGLAGTVLGPHAVQLSTPCPVHALPGFADGDVSVQDASAQRAAPLLIGAGLPPGARVLDACAAPGGKTAHLLELAELDVLALDSDSQRLQRVRETLERLRLDAALAAADARHPADWWDGRPFDAILLDAPCSASGIVRRHPDVRWLRRPDDVAALASTQRELLDALWPLLAPGGRLLYATCSVFRAEGQDVIDAFLQRGGPDAPRLDPASPGHLLPVADNLPTTPAPDAHGAGAAGDGFFYALLHKP